MASNNQTKADRMRAKNDAMQQRQLDKTNTRSKIVDLLAIQRQLEMATDTAANKKRELRTWTDQMVAGGEVRWQIQRGRNAAHFAGIDSTELNRQLRRKHEEIVSLQRTMEHCKNLLTPGRTEGILVKHAVPQKTDVTIIERRCVGVFINKEENGDPSNIRCYHSREGDSIFCDCFHEGNVFTLSMASQELLLHNKLEVDMSVVDQQRQALIGVQVGQSLPNVFLPGGPRDFDVQIWCDKC
jgi:hypothetical protein